MILAGVAIVVAGFFLLRRNFDTAFVIAALGMVAWFLNYRAQMKRIVAANSEENNNGCEDEAHEDLDYE
jgi:uncharacterized membrane protein